MPGTKSQRLTAPLPCAHPPALSRTCAPAHRHPRAAGTPAVPGMEQAGASAPPVCRCHPLPMLALPSLSTSCALWAAVFWPRMPLLKPPAYRQPTTSGRRLSLLAREGKVVGPLPLWCPSWHCWLRLRGRTSWGIPLVSRTGRNQLTQDQRRGQGPHASRERVKQGGRQVGLLGVHRCMVGLLWVHHSHEGSSRTWPLKMRQ